MSLVITTNGNAIDITDNGSATGSLVNEAYNWYFHNDVLRLKAGPMDLFAAVGSVEIDGNTPVNEADLNTALGAVFPSDAGGGSSAVDIETKADSFSLSAADLGKTILANGAGTIQISVLEDATLNLPVGSFIDILNVNGGGDVTILPVGDVELRSINDNLSITNKGAAILTKIGPDLWTLTGDLNAPL